MKYFVAALSALLLAVSDLPGSTLASDQVASRNQPASERPLTTYERFLPLAVAGDPAIQHFLGYMFFYGEGVELNYDEAHFWFRSAAEEGDPRAQRNLGIFHARAIDRIPPKFYDAAEANLWFSLAAANPAYSDYSPRASKAYIRFLSSGTDKTRKSTNRRYSGKLIYQRSCAGCHGFDGRSAYPQVPSFALGDRLDRSDRVLLDSILQGKGKMPSSPAGLSSADAERVLSYIRSQSRKWNKSSAGKSGSLDAGAARKYVLGERIYLEFCGGCHGFNGIAWYVNSPSFALRERLHKSDEELINSIKNGRGAMPSWEYMLKPGQIEAVLEFIRSLAPSYESGLLGELRHPGLYLRFRPKGETGPNWTGDDQR